MSLPFTACKILGIPCACASINVLGSDDGVDDTAGFTEIDTLACSVPACIHEVWLCRRLTFQDGPGTLAHFVLGVKY